MKHSEIVKDAAARLQCRRRYRTMVADLDALSDRLLEELGLWRGAIAAAADEILASQGCPPPPRRPPWRDAGSTTDQGTWQRAEDSE